MQLHLDIAPRRRVSVGLTCAAATIALAVAMGVGRFAFTAMLPLMLREGLLEAEAASWLAASNYLGYLLGALVAARIPMRPSRLIGASLAGIAVATAGIGVIHDAMAWNLLRFVAGVLSAWGLIATSAWVLEQLSDQGRSDLAGVAFSGVGIGIALVGVFCIVAARPGVSSALLWLELGALSALAGDFAVALIVRRPERIAARVPAKTSASVATRSWGLVISYGAFGFGYILPATFLPLLARQVIDDPQVFGLSWPLFGLAAAVSTILTGWYLKRANRLAVLAIGHVVMAVGVLLPSLWLSAVTVGLAALLVGSTFMVITMLGMQEARARQPENPTPILARMTAAFAIGQLAGPIVNGVLTVLVSDHAAALDVGLQVATVALVASALYLWFEARRSTSENRRPP